MASHSIIAAPASRSQIQYCGAACSNAASPSAASNFKFARINFASGNSGQNHGATRLRNTTQNDGGTAGTKDTAVAARAVAGTADAGAAGT
jgi:hypothetical protein